MSAGKGDSPRPVDAKTYGQNYDNIFRKTKCQTTLRTTGLKSLSEDQGKNLGKRRQQSHSD
jgi:hypothetical protein